MRGHGLQLRRQSCAQHAHCRRVSFDALAIRKARCLIRPWKRNPATSMSLSSSFRSKSTFFTGWAPRAHCTILAPGHQPPKISPQRWRAFGMVSNSPLRMQWISRACRSAWSLFSPSSRRDLNFRFSGLEGRAGVVAHSPITIAFTADRVLRLRDTRFLFLGVQPLPRILPTCLRHLINDGAAILSFSSSL